MDGEGGRKVAGIKERMKEKRETQPLECAIFPYILHITQLSKPTVSVQVQPGSVSAVLLFFSDARLFA